MYILWTILGVLGGLLLIALLILFLGSAKIKISVKHSVCFKKLLKVLPSKL